MNPARWQQVSALLERALDYEPAARASFLDAECSGDRGLRQEVESLLGWHGGAAGFLEQPLAELLPALGDAAGGGQQIAAYRLLSVVGRGGMSVVYRAERIDGEFEQEVAVKILRPGLATADLVRRFRAERQILASLEHPGIARLLDGGTTANGLPYLVMEHVEGTRIDHFCAERELSVEACLRLFQKVCAAVHFAHQRLVVHRDLKPSNILVDAMGEPKLLDFGIAKLLAVDGDGPATALTLESGSPMTPEYASPEQVLCQPTTTACDIYSLGALLYELLSGKRAHELGTRTPEEIKRAVCEVVPARPSAAAGTPRRRRQLSGDLDNIALKALAKEPERRYPSADELARDLERYLKGQPVLAHRDSVLYRARKFARRHRLGLAASAVIAILGAGVGRAILSERQRTAAERQRAEVLANFLTEVFNASDPRRAQGKELTARDVLARGSETLEASLSDQPRTKALLLSTLGKIYRTLGENREAERLARLALDTFAEAADTRILDLTAEHQHLATALQRQGRFDEAEVHARQSVELGRALPLNENPGLILSLVELGRVIRQQGRLDEAAEFLGEALKLARSLIHEPKHPQVSDDFPTITALAANELASLHVEAGDYAAAEPLYREALAIYRERYTDPHPYIAAAANNLGRLLILRGSYAEAEPLLRDSLRANGSLTGARSQPTIAPRFQLGRLLTATGRGEEAKGLLTDTRTMILELEGQGSLDDALVLGYLTEALLATDGAAAAEPSARESLALLQARFGEKNRAVHLARERLARVLLARGERLEAANLARQALAGLRGIVAPQHPDLALVRGTLERAEGDR